MIALDSLVRSAQRGDKSAFGVLVRHYQNMAYGVSYARVDDPDVAQDVAQEAFVDAYLSLDKLRELAAFSGWFYRILVKHADRVLRARRVMVSPDVLQTLPSQLPDPYLVAEANEVHGAVAELPERHRLAVVLYYLEGYSQKEVAEFLGLPVSTVKKRLFDARKRLKARMTMAEETIVDVSKDDGFAQTISNLVFISFTHFHHLNPKPDGYRYPYPDFIQINYMAQAVEHLPNLKLPDDYEIESYFHPINEVHTLISDIDLTHLRAALTVYKEKSHINP